MFARTKTAKTEISRDHLQSSSSFSSSSPCTSFSSTLPYSTFSSSSPVLYPLSPPDILLLPHSLLHPPHSLLHPPPSSSPLSQYDTRPHLLLPLFLISFSTFSSSTTSSSCNVSSFSLFSLSPPDTLSPFSHLSPPLPPPNSLPQLSLLPSPHLNAFWTVLLPKSPARGRKSENQFARKLA